MFPYSGINASEEPKTSIVVSGLQNTSDFVSATGESILSSPSLGGLGEFTFMMWIWSTSTGTIVPYFEISTTSLPLILYDDGSVDSLFRNQNGGDTTVTAIGVRSYNEWENWTVTGSVINGRIRIYKNGVLLNSATMTYPNSNPSSASLNNTDYYSSQLNMWNRELDEAEVRSHYIYDSVLSRSGVVSFNAMTTAQKSGLSYCSSMTDNISFSGNEFNDKSGSNITMSPKPQLTGQQIYVYTDVNDIPTQPTNGLPSTLPTIL